MLIDKQDAVFKGRGRLLRQTPPPRLVGIFPEAAQAPASWGVAPRLSKNPHKRRAECVVCFLRASGVEPAFPCPGEPTAFVSSALPGPGRTMPVLSSRRKRLASIAGPRRGSGPSLAVRWVPPLGLELVSDRGRGRALMRPRGPTCTTTRRGAGRRPTMLPGPPGRDLQRCGPDPGGASQSPRVCELAARAARPLGRVEPGPPTAASREGAVLPRAEARAGSGRGARSGEWGLAAAGAWETVSVGLGPRPGSWGQSVGTAKLVRVPWHPVGSRCVPVSLFGPRQAAVPTSHP